MASRIIRRIIYAVLAAALIFGVVRRETSLDHHVIFTALVTIQTAIFLLLVWCSVFAGVEAKLTRIALVLVLLAFWLTFWVYRDSQVSASNQTMQPPAPRFTISLLMIKTFPLQSAVGFGRRG